MIRVGEVQLDDITLPGNGIGIVIMQPFVELTDHEPYHWQNNKKRKQIERIVRTLEIAKKPEHGCEKTNFTIFPEYSIPGLEGVQKIQTILRSNSWQTGTIVIGGIDGLTKGEYTTLCSEDNAELHEENKPEKIRDDQWVNCCITWMKEANGSLKQWIQLKLSPSWPEKNITHSRMFTGSSLYVFSGKFDNQTDFRFFSLICFDWIGPIGRSYGIEAILSEINNCWHNTRKEMSLVFLLQNNRDPNHRNFIENARNYFDIRTKYPFINRSDGTIICANTAGGLLPGKYQNYGYSSLIFSPVVPYDTNGCPPTFAVITKKLRGTENLGRCKEALFREMGACIHSFRFRLPQFVNLGPADRCLPIDEAIVYAIDHGSSDPRTSGKPVPASVKWTNDHLDNIASLLENEQRHPLKNDITNAYIQVSEHIRKQPGDFLCKYIVMASCCLKEKDKWIEIGGGPIPNIDKWDEKEEESLETVVYSLSIIKVCKPLEVRDSPAHATIKIPGKVFDVIVVSGKTHDDCFKYAKDQYRGSGQRFIIVVTRDIHNTSWDKKFKSYLDVQVSTEQDPIITDPDSRFRRCGYQNLISNCFNTQNLTELNNKITEVIGL